MPKLTGCPAQSFGFDYGFVVISPPADVLLDEGRYRTMPPFIEVLEIPGHSSGHVVYVWKGTKPDRFWRRRAVCRAGHRPESRIFLTAASRNWARGIHRKLFTMPDDTLVLPGHGDPTTIGDEKRSNPFVGRPRLARLSRIRSRNSRLQCWPASSVQQLARRLGEQARRGGPESSRILTLASCKLASPSWGLWPSVKRLCTHWS